MGWIDDSTYVMEFNEAEAMNLPYFIKSIQQDRRYKGSDKTPGVFWVPTDFDGHTCLANVKIDDDYRVDYYIYLQLEHKARCVIEYAVDSESYDTFVLWNSGNHLVETGGQTGWRTITLNLEPSSSSIHFAYTKDYSGSKHSDKAYIKSITFYGVERDMEKRWIVRVGDEYKAVQDSSWVSLGKAPTKDSILALGSKEPPQPELLIQLCNPVVVKWQEYPPNSTPSSFNYTAIPTDTLWCQRGSVSLDASYIKGIKGVSINCQLSKNASLLFAFSNDNGASWKYLASGQWQSLSYTVDAFRKYGMTKSFVEGISEKDWNAFMEGSRTIKFACVASVMSSSDYIRFKQVQYNFIVEGVK